MRQFIPKYHTDIIMMWIVRSLTEECKTGGSIIYKATKVKDIQDESWLTFSLIMYDVALH